MVGGIKSIQIHDKFTVNVCQIKIKNLVSIMKKNRKYMYQETNYSKPGFTLSPSMERSKHSRHVLGPKLED
jgi:hypothetical protein